jgi:anti-sigma B factor antagonist
MIEFNLKAEKVTYLSMSGKILSDEDISPMLVALDSIRNWNIVFDLTELTHTNSSGIAFMVKILTRARINGGDLVILNPNTGLSKLFEITKMHEVFSIYTSKENAINHFN